MENFRLPTDRTGYIFHFEVKAADPVNNITLNVTKFAENEAEAIQMIRDDIGKIAFQLEKRAKPKGILSPLSP